MIRGMVALMIRAQAAGAPQESTHTGKATDIAALLKVARTLPPELAADVFIKIVESGLVKDNKARAAVLNEAFALAGQTQERLPRRWVYPYGPYTTVKNALAKGLDQVSLRGRIVGL